MACRATVPGSFDSRGKAGAVRCDRMRGRRCRRPRVRCAGVHYEVLVDRTERPKKCSILPLGYRSDFRIVRFDRRRPILPLTGSLLLHPDGVPLSRLTAGQFPSRDAITLSAIDCNWKRLETVVSRITGPLPPRVRVPDGFQTLYPRRNKRNLDPETGLATIEALFIASVFLGVWDESLLREYPMADEFLRVNVPVFARHGFRAMQRDD